MRGLQLARRQGRLALTAALCLFTSLTLSAQPASAPVAVDTVEASRAAASAASAVAAATSAASAARAASASGPDGTPSGQCPRAGAPYCQAVPFGWLLTVLALYAAAFAAVRWYLVARPNLRNLEGQVGALRQWVAAHPSRAAPGDLDDTQLEQLLGRIEALVAPDKHDFLDKLLWSRGGDLIGWQLFYQARELLVARMPPEALRCCLEDAAQALPSADPAAADLAQRIKDELKLKPLDPRDTGQAVLQEVRAYLARVDSPLNGEVDRMVDSRATATPPTAAAALDLVRRLATALRPPASLVQRLADSRDLLPLWQQLVEHARDVALPAATARQQALDALATAAAPPTADACLDALERSRDERRMLQGLSTRLQIALDAAPLASSERRIALAREALARVHHAFVDDYDTRFTWHRKSLWLGMTALLLVLLLSLAVGNPLLFLMGAFGGLLSRLRVAVTGGGLGQGQELQWTSLLLSPLLGALAAWGGMLLISLGVQFEVLGDTFTALVWDAPLSPAWLGVALLLGFAERLFLDVANQLQPKFGAPATAAPQAKPGT